MSLGFALAAVYDFKSEPRIKVVGVWGPWPRREDAEATMARYRRTDYPRPGFDRYVIVELVEVEVAVPAESGEDER